MARFTNYFHPIIPRGYSHPSVRPSHTETARAPEFGFRTARMKAGHVKTTTTTGAVSSHPGDKDIGAKKGLETTSAPGKTYVGPKK